MWTGGQLGVGGGGGVPGWSCGEVMAGVYVGGSVDGHLGREGC